MLKGMVSFRPRPSTRATMAAIPGPGEAAAMKRAEENRRRPAGSMTTPAVKRWIAITS
jgi:hypothetical protein